MKIKSLILIAALSLSSAALISQTAYADNDKSDHNAKNDNDQYGYDRDNNDRDNQVDNTSTEENADNQQHTILKKAPARLTPKHPLSIPGHKVTD